VEKNLTQRGAGEPWGVGGAYPRLSRDKNAVPNAQTDTNPRSTAKRKVSGGPREQQVTGLQGGDREPQKVRLPGRRVLRKQLQRSGEENACRPRRFKKKRVVVEETPKKREKKSKKKPAGTNEKRSATPKKKPKKK